MNISYILFHKITFLLIWSHFTHRLQMNVFPPTVFQAEYLEWIPESLHGEVITLWPPLVSMKLQRLILEVGWCQCY